MANEYTAPATVTRDKMNVVVWSGNKYGFHSVYVPALRDLCHIASIHVYLMDYPEDYDLNPLLEELCGSGVLQSYTFVPRHRNQLRHHRALRKVYRSLIRGKLDLIIVDDDSQPVSKTFIQAARTKNIPVLGLQETGSHVLLAAFESAMSASSSPGHSPVPSRPGLRRYDKLRKWLRMSVQRPGFVAAVLFQGRSFKYNDYLRVTAGLPSIQVDATIVYTDRFRKALLHFFPQLNVVVARHPLYQNCRCNGRESKTALLATLSGPWMHWTNQGNTTESIQEKWCEAILRAVDLKGFEDVHIRPHPGETQRYPYALAERLRERGVRAKVLDAKVQSLPEIICDYAGVISAPSGALAEAAVACKRAFVIGIQKVAVEDFSPSIPYIADDVVFRMRGSDLTEEDFTKLPPSDAARPTVRQAVEGLMAEPASTSG